MPNYRRTQLSTPNEKGVWIFINPEDLEFDQIREYSVAKVRQRVGVCNDINDDPFSYVQLAGIGDYIVQNKEGEFFVVLEANKEEIL